MKILFAVSNENVSNRIVESYKKRFQETVSSKNVFYFNAILRELQRDKTYDSIVISEDLEPFANSNYDVIDKFIVERLQEVSQEISRIGKDISIIIICTDRRTKTSYVLNKLYEFGVYNALIGSDRRIDNVCNLINTPRTQAEAKEYYNIQEDELGNNLDDVSEQEVQNILIHYKKLGKNEDRYTDSFNNIAAQYNDKQLRIIIKCLPINVRAVLESECPKYQELVTTQDETEEERKQKEIIQEQRRQEKEENDRKLQAKIEKERREAEKRALKEQKAAEKAAAKAGNAAPVPQQFQEMTEDVPEEIPEVQTETQESIPEPVSNPNVEPAPASIPSYSTPKQNTGGSTGIDLLDRKKKEPRMTGNVIIPGNMNIRNERKLYSDEELENLASTPREPVAADVQPVVEENASPISMPETELQMPEEVLPGTEEVETPVESTETVLPGMEDVSVPTEPVEAVLPGMEDVSVPTEPVEAVLPGVEDVSAPTEPVEAVLPGMEDVTVPEEPVEAVLPGMEDVSVPEEPVEAVLPGMEDVSAPTEPVEAVLPGMEDVSVPEEPVEAVLPGMEDVSAPTEPVEAVLPGMEDVSVPEEPVEAVLPGMEDVSVPEEPVEAVLPGMEDVSVPTEPVEAVLPGMEDVSVSTEPVEAVLPGMEDATVPTEPVEAVLPGMETEETKTPELDTSLDIEQKDDNETTETEQTSLDGFEALPTDSEEEPKKRGRGRPRKYPVDAAPKPKGKRGRPRKNPLPEEVNEGINETADLPGFEQVTENVPSVQLPDDSNVNQGPLYVQTPTGPIAVEKEQEPETTDDMTGFEDVAVSSTYVEKVTADNIEVPEDEPEEPTVEVPEVQNTPVEPTVEPATYNATQEAVSNVVPVNDLFEEVQTVELSSSNTVKSQEQPTPMQKTPVEDPFEQTIEQTPLTQTNPVNQVEEFTPINNVVEPVQQANDLDSQVNGMKQNMEVASEIEQPIESTNPYQAEKNQLEVNPMPMETLPMDNQFDNVELGGLQSDNSIDAGIEGLDSTSIDTETPLPGMEDFNTPAAPVEPVESIQPVEPVQPIEPIEPVQTNVDAFSSLDSSMTSTSELGGLNGLDEEDEQEESYEDLYASTVSNKRLQADNYNPQNNVTVDQPATEAPNEFEAQPSQNFGVGPQIDQATPVEAYVPNDNRMQSIQALEENKAYTTGSLSQVLTKDKKIVAFVGASKAGTSFLINNLATLFSSLGIRTAILDMTKNKNSYFIYTNNDENLRNIAYNCIENLENGIAEGIKVDRNLDVYTAIPNDGKDYSNAEPILSTLIQNESLVLIDCDFTTPWGYFANASEIYLVQSMDILTIQPLTAFLRELKTRGLLEQDKLRVVVNKELKVKGLSSKVIIGGMSFYNDPAMSFMTELFNKDRIKACTIPFDDNVYSKYLEQLVNCQITIGGYPKAFMNNLKILGNMVYPLLSKQTYSNNSGGGNYGNSGYNNNFSPEMNNTLNQMRNKY